MYVYIHVYIIPYDLSWLSHTHVSCVLCTRDKHTICMSYMYCTQLTLTDMVPITTMVINTMAVLTITMLTN